MTTATLIPPGNFTVQFREFSYTAYRLETLQSYAGSGEDEDLAAFAAGRPEPGSPEKDEWTAMIAANHRAGRIQQRVHVVTEPLTDYMRFELTWAYAPNVAAGEDIRIIPGYRDGEWPYPLPQFDYWLFDSRDMYINRYTEDGIWLGAEPVEDPDQIVSACHWRDAALYRAVPWRQYIATRPELHRYLTP